MSTRACLGGWCCLRDSCPNHVSPTNRVNPSERLCDRRRDGYIDGQPVRIYRAVGTWEKQGGFIDLMKRAGPWDALQ